MILETNRLILRPWQDSDAEELYKYAKAPAVATIAGRNVHTSVEYSRENVNNITAAIAADGYEILRRPRVMGDGYYESVVLDNDGNQIEITV